jgi:hypothetical protein
MRAPFPQKVRWLRRLWILQHGEYVHCSLLMIVFRITLCLTLINKVLQQSFYECRLKTSRGTTTSYVSTLVYLYPFFDYYFWLGIRHRYQPQDGSASQRHRTRHLCVLRTRRARYCAEQHRHHQLQHQHRHGQRLSRNQPPPLLPLRIPSKLLLGFGLTLLGTQHSLATSGENDVTTECTSPPSLQFLL